MLQEHNPTPAPEGENGEPNGAQIPSNESFESDTQRIIHRHLQNKDDVITDEDIAGIRVGMAPPHIDADGAEQLEEEVEAAAEDSEDENTEDEQITPWDVTKEES